jgi:hypothetical protein
MPLNQILILVSFLVVPFVPVLLGATFGPLIDLAIAARERRAWRAAQSTHETTLETHPPSAWLHSASADA